MGGVCQICVHCLHLARLPRIAYVAVAWYLHMSMLLLCGVRNHHLCRLTFSKDNSYLGARVLWQ